MLKLIASRIPKRFYASPPKDSIYKEEYLKLAREWPHEFYDPSHFEEVNNEEPKVTPEMLALQASSFDNPEPAQLSSHFWRRLLILGVASAAFYRFNEHYSEQNKPNPITQMMQEWIKNYDGYKTYKEEMVSIPVRQSIANDQLILQSKNQFEKPMKRISFPGTFERASDFVIPIGSQVDVSNLDYHYTWQQNDKYFGVPYPE